MNEVAYDLKSVRKELSNQIQYLEDLVGERPIHGAELTLALRHLQDARMRIGVALTIKDGKNPWITE